MQLSKTEYNAENCEKHKALCVKQPYADLLLDKVAGTNYAKKSIEVRSRPTKYRGDLLICSSKLPKLQGRYCGATIGFVELYAIKPVEMFTLVDWEATQIPKEKRSKIKGGWGWFMRNPRKVIEKPCKGQLGIYDYICPKDDITPYPTAIKIDLPINK